MGFLAFMLSFSAAAKEPLALFQQGMQAIAEKQNPAPIYKQLGDAYPLLGYLEFASLNARFPNVSPDEVQRFRQRYNDTPLATELYANALTSYARVGNWKAFLGLADKRPTSLNLRCNYIQALASKRQTQQAQQELQALVQLAQALPTGCQAVIARLHSKALTQDDLETLMQQAFLQGQKKWLETLSQWLPKSNPLRTKAVRLFTSPAQAQQLLSEERYKVWYELALHRLASKNPELALSYWQSSKAKSMLSDSSKQTLGARIAWFSSISSKQPNRPWLDEWLNAHANSMANTLEQRARYAIREQDWQGLLHWISLLPIEKQMSSQWLYWQARAYEHTDNTKLAQSIYVFASSERSFYGFLAAEKSNQPYFLNETNSPATPLKLNEKHRAALTRVHLLLQAGYQNEAIKEWNYLLNQVPNSEQIALAHYVEQQQWHHFSITAANQSGQWNQLGWRFPLAWQDEFEQAMSTHAYLAMAVARRESSFSPYAQSPAGARGLMQLMPNTARSLAKRQNQNFSLQSLFDWQTNLLLGTNYLADLLERYQGNSVLTLAAYNAGPHRVSRWLRESAVPFDEWIETIPFKETREYVQAVLSYRVIFMSRAGVEVEQVALLSHAEKRFEYTQTNNEAIQTLVLAR